MIQPLGNRILLKMQQKEEKTKSGIILGNNIDKIQIAEVIEVGNGEENSETKIYVKKKDKVIIEKYAGTEIKYDGEDYILVKQDEILAIVGGRDE